MPPPFPGCLTSRRLRLLVRLQRLRLRSTDLARRTAGGFLDLLAPGWCRVCRVPCSHESPLCVSCAADVIRIRGACERCGLPVRAADSGVPIRFCSACAGRRWHFDRVVAAAEYSDAVRDLVLLHKFHADAGAREFLVEELLRALSRLDLRPDATLCSVPQHPLKTLARGRDPCRELALGLARRSRLPFAVLLRKRRWTRAQMLLSRPARRRGPRGSISPRFCRPAPSQVLLVDDVVTTGTTVSVCAEALKSRGVDRVDVLAAARAVT